MTNNHQRTLRDLEARLDQLLSGSVLRFDKGLRGALPESQGVYRIFDPNVPEQTMRAGRTKTAAGGLQQRVYQNHLMGTQNGNLRRQLVNGGVSADMESAKAFMRERLAVQVLVVEDSDERQTAVVCDGRLVRGKVAKDVDERRRRRTPAPAATNTTSVVVVISLK